MLLSGRVPPEDGRHFAVPAAGLLPVPQRETPLPLGWRPGGRRLACAGWRGWVTGGWRRRIKPPRLALRPTARSCEPSWKRPAGPLTDSRAPWSRCGPGLPRTRPTPSASLPIVWHPLLNRDPATLRGRICVGPAAMCAELLCEYAEAGCCRVHFWPVGDERRQIELLAAKVLPGCAPCTVRSRADGIRAPSLERRSINGESCQ